MWTQNVQQFVKKMEPLKISGQLSSRLSFCARTATKIQRDLHKRAYLEGPVD